MKLQSVIVLLIMSCGAFSFRLQAQDLSVTVTPPDDPIVDPSTGIQLTADATPANGADGACVTFDWADPDGDWGAGTVTGMESVLSYYPEGDLYGTDDDVTCTVTDGVGDTDMDDVGLYVPMIWTTTFESSTQAGTRSTIGIGEQVYCDIIPADMPGISSATWSNSGSGTFDTKTGNQVVYSAYCVVESDTVTATLPDGVAINQTFSVLQPTIFTDVYQNQDGNQNARPLDNGFIGIFYAGPDTVNFYNCSEVEQSCGAACTGFFTYKEDETHVPNPDPIAFTSSVTAGWGTQNMGNDDATISCFPFRQANGIVVGGGPPYNPGGTFNWPIPEMWVLNGIEGQIGIGNQTATVTVNGNNASEGIQKSASPAGVAPAQNGPNQ